MVGQQSVVLLDTLRDHLGVVHSLARTRRYRLKTLGFAREEALRYSRTCQHEVLPNWRWDGGCEQLDGLAAPADGAVLFPVSLRATEWVIQHRQELTPRWQLVPLPEAADFYLANDKARLAELAGRIGLHVPTWIEPADPAACDGQRMRFPVLLKPRRGFGGSGIVRCESPTELSKVLAEITSPANYLVQSLIPGQDMSCGVFCRAGEVLAQVIYQPLARQGQFGRFTSIQSVKDHDVATVVARLMRALHWNGIANIDLVRARDGAIHVLEVNPRCWGNMAAGVALGVNFADLLCRAAVGLDLTPQTGREGRFFGILDSLALFRDAVVHRKVRRRLHWRRLLTTESSLRFVASDPMPYLASVFQSGTLRGVLASFRKLWEHHAPKLPG